MKASNTTTKSTLSSSSSTITASTSSIATSSSVQERWSEANIASTVQLWKFDTRQESILRQLQPLLKDIDHWKNDPHEVARYMKDFYKLSVPKMADKFRHMVEWRISERMDTFCASYYGHPPPPIFSYFPIFLLGGYDYEGDPIYMIRPGVLDAQGLLSLTSAKDILDYVKFLQEVTLTRYTPGIPKHWNWQTEHYEKTHGGKRFTQFTVIVDLQGLGRRHLRGSFFGVLQQITRIGQDYYAGVRKRILIVRAPRIFQLVWNVVKVFLDEHVHELISISTPADYHQVCDRYLDRKILPPEMGGQGRAMPGFFHEFIRMNGGMIPKDVGTKRSGPFAKGALTTSPTFDMSDDDDNNEPFTAPTTTAIAVKSLLRGHFDVSSITNEVTTVSLAGKRTRPETINYSARI
ncbi:SEC14-like protein 5 [Seminavis robusta]|uniref:SEC14-like protein 5 n=1 Tax=Seminavis robusta TaxID=568900 RepID=A0A9N8HLU4_9STRA|nr:SEC14-like protein 5 [Seminavis robusta]|eukprot:Sro842_g209670.1 SEC14-like protein 5 (406) ;mRNA; f:11575-12792